MTSSASSWMATAGWAASGPRAVEEPEHARNLHVPVPVFPPPGPHLPSPSPSEAAALRDEVTQEEVTGQGSSGGVGREQPHRNARASG